MTRIRNSAATVELPFSTFETVPSETPASLATSFIVGLRRMELKLRFDETLYETFYDLSGEVNPCTLATNVPEVAPLDTAVAIAAMTVMPMV
jgi:hypothetical protein